MCIRDSTTTAVISAAFENNNGGNTGSITAYQNSVAGGVDVASVDAATKGSGSGYVVRN